MATPSNRFEQVEEPRPDAVTVVLWEEDGHAWGRVLGPAAAEPGQQSLMIAGEDNAFTAHEALAIGCHLGNELHRDVVVVDPHRLWQPGWGQLQSLQG